MLPFAFIALLLVQQAPQVETNEIDSVRVEAQEPGTLTDQRIKKQLNALLVSEPDRVVCMPRTPQQRTRLTVARCASLREWYDMSAVRAMKSLGKSGNSGLPMTVGDLYAPVEPPYELVDLIRERMRNPRLRAQAEARAGANLPVVTQIKR